MQSLLNCFECTKRFNNGAREPIIMMCCGKTACRHCVKEKMIKSPQNRERNIAEKGDFQCTGCNKQYYCNDDSHKQFVLIVNESIKNFVAQDGDSSKISCKDHPDVSAQRYCINHRSLICKECVYENHEDHVKKCLPLNQEGIMDFFRQNIAKAKAIRDKINIMIE